jgi:hypothetical protein
MMEKVNAWNRWAIVWILVVAFVQILTLREGHLWGGDFALFLLHAQNLVEGIPYAATGYIPSPYYGPPTYPPGFPLLIAPVYALFGMDIQAMKLVIVVSYAVALWFVYRLLAIEGGAKLALFVIAVLGLNPWFWDYKDELISDIPFFMFTAMALLATRWAHGADLSLRGRIGAGILLAILIYLAYATRSIGLMLAPAALAFLILNRQPRFTLAATTALVFGLLFVAHEFLMDSTGGYESYFTLDPRIIAGNLLLAVKMISGWFVHEEVGTVVRAVVYLPVLLLAVIGLVPALRRPGILEWFAAFYMLPILMFDPFLLDRYLIPLIPIFVFYATRGFLSVSRRVSPRIAGFAATALLVLMAVFYIDAYLRLPLREIPQGISSPDTRGVVDFVAAETAPDAVFIVFRPRTFALLTDRSAAGYYGVADDQGLDRLFDESGAGYLMITDSTLDEGMFGSGPELLRSYVADRQDFRRVFANATFSVYKKVL